MAPPDPIFRFGPYESRPRTRELFKHGSRLKIRPQPLQILNLLLSRAGDVVTREELRQELWTSDTFVDFERGLNSSVMELRAVLGDSAAEARYIETLVKIGYRFVAPVEVSERSLGAVPRQPEVVFATSSEVEVAAPLIPELRSRPQKHFWRWGIALGTAIALVTVMAYVQSSRLRERRKLPSGKIMFAVLPFENLTGDAAQDYFSDGLTEEMIAQLSRLDPNRIGVIARMSVMHYKNTSVQLPQIAQDLGVQYVLQGSVRRDGDRVRINAQLMQVNDQVPLWSRQYDRELSNLLALQGEIAHEVGDEIQLALGGGGPNKTNGRPTITAPATSYEVYDLYLKGRYFWNKRNPQSFRQAAEYFQLAIDKDPNYAPAYAGLADTFALLSSYGYAPPAEFIPKARAAALKALQIDESLAGAHVSLAVIAQNYDWDWTTAEREYRRAIQIDPSYATAHHWYAECLGFEGRFDEAFAESELARKLDPLSLIVSADHAALLYFSRQYDRSIAEFRRVLEMEPNFPRAYIVIFPLVEKGLFAEALADVDKWKRVVDSPWPLAVQVYVYARSGQMAQARRSMQELQHLDQRKFLDPAAMLMAHVAMDNKDQTFAWLKKCYDARSPLTTLKVDPMYDPLRSDPRFQKFLHDVRLAP
jgi:TolB-like protein/DNA-binding winged helix-turn-helix (wHTH) protein/Tfp pilus assembly protein PilF